MAEALFLGAAVGAVFGTAVNELYASLKKLVVKNLAYEPILEESISRLYSLKPYIEQMEEVYSNEELQGLHGVINEGEVLVGGYLVYGEPPKEKDREKFRKWDDRLKGEIEALNLSSKIDIRKTAVTETKIIVQNLEELFRGALKLLNNRSDREDKNQSAENEDFCAVPELPLLTVGQDAPIKKLKRMMFENKKSMVVVNAVGGSGKSSTLTALNSIQQSSIPGKELHGLEEVKKMGEMLVSDCKEVNEWDPFTKYKYTNKLLAWKESIDEELKRLRLHLLTEGKMIASTVENTASRVEGVLDIKNIVMQASASSSFTALQPPELQQDIYIVGFDTPLRELKEKLLTDHGPSVLVLTAPGGCGKTTLATMFCKDEQVKEKFQKGDISNIFFITVSQKGNLDLIVQRFCEYKGWNPDILNEVHSLQLLQKFLKEQHNPFLLVLDDVWSGSDFFLDKLNQLKSSNFKILVTSRSEFPRFGPSHHLRMLEDNDAMKLFRHTASLEDRSSPIPESIVKKIVEQCKGFPLAIKVVGRSLAGQPREMWESREIEWSRGSSLILDTEIELFLCLQSSFDALDEKLKECFLDLGSFPEDKQIPVAALMDIWAESFALDRDALCITKLQELKNRSLANLLDERKKKMEGEGYYNEHFVTQHDLLRELTIYHSRLEDAEDVKRLIIEMCGNNLPNWLEKQKHQPTKARLISISTDGEFTTWPDIQLPDAEVLVLNFQTKKYALPQSVKKMKKLKVLILTNEGFSFSRAELSNFQLLGSLSKLKRIRLEGISRIPLITNYPAELSSVQKITLCKCDIRKAFENGCIKMSNAFPNLQELNIDYDLGELSADICDLVNLKKLCITNCLWLSIFPGCI